MASIDYSIKEAEKVIKLDGTIKNIEVSRLTKPGDNYLSLILKTDFEIEKNGVTKTVNAVAKRLPLGRKEKSFDFMGFAMLNEIRWYAEIVPVMEEFAAENGIEVDFFPEYLGSRCSLDESKVTADDDAVLFMENLALKGYKLADRYTGFDLITAKAILRRLAVFHALPIAMKLTKPEKFQIIKEAIAKGRPPMPGGEHGPPGSDGPEKDPFTPPPGAENLQEVLQTELQKIPEFASYLSRLEPMLKDAMHPMNFLQLTEEPWNTITHNDFWVNNVMVNWRGDGEEPLVKIVDFQMCSYSSYAMDLVFFLLDSIDNEVTKESLDELLRFYYDVFTSVLRKASAEVELSYEDYLKEVRNIACTSQIGHAVFFSTIIFAEKGTVVDTAVEVFDPFKEIPDMIRRMNRKQKDKLVVIATESAKRGWI